MSSTSIKAFSLLAMILSGQADAFSNSSQETNSTQSIASSYKPPEFIENYNHSFCPSNTNPIYVPPVVAYYPYSTQAVWAIIGDFYNISWINPAIKTQGEGPDNVIGAIRHQQGDPFAKTEILSAYYASEAPNNQGFFGQMSNYAPDTVDAEPGWTIEKIRPVLTLVPACGVKAAQLGFYLTYCMGSNRTAQKPGFNEAAASVGFSESAFKGSAGALASLWKELDGGRRTAFNSTATCAAVATYQGQDGQKEQRQVQRRWH